MGSFGLRSAVTTRTDNVPEPHSVGNAKCKARAAPRPAVFVSPSAPARGRCKVGLWLATAARGRHPRPGRRFAPLALTGLSPANEALDAAVILVHRSRSTPQSAGSTFTSCGDDVRSSDPWQFHNRSRRNRGLPSGPACTLRDIPIAPRCGGRQPAIRLQPDRSAGPPPDRQTGEISQQ
jgi:hypothetical protein